MTLKLRTPRSVTRKSSPGQTSSPNSIRPVVGGRNRSTICSVNRLVSAVFGMLAFLPGERWGSKNSRFPAELVATLSAQDTYKRQTNAYSDGYWVGKVGTEDSALAKVEVVSSNLIARSNFPI